MLHHVSYNDFSLKDIDPNFVGLHKTLEDAFKLLNPYGRNLLNLAKSHNVLIMNGLPFYPYFWSFKCLPHVKGQCAIHYVLAHMELLYCILLFKCFTPFQRTLCISLCLGPQRNPLFYHPLVNLPIPILIIPSHLPFENPLPTPHGLPYVGCGAWSSRFIDVIQ